MSNLKKLLRARERLVAHGEWAKAGAKYYENLHLASQVGIRNIDLALERVQEASKRTKEVGKEHAVKARTVSGKKTGKRVNSGLPPTGEAFWLGFLDYTGRSTGDVLEAALKALKKEHSFVPAKDDKAALRNRLSVALAQAANAGKVKAEGPRGERVYRLLKRRAKQGAANSGRK